MFYFSSLFWRKRCNLSKICHVSSEWFNHPIEKLLFQLRLSEFRGGLQAIKKAREYSQVLKNCSSPNFLQLKKKRTQPIYLGLVCFFTGPEPGT